MDSPEQEVAPPAEACEYLIEAYDLAKEGRLGGAAHRCELALALVPNWSQAHFFHGVLLEEMGFVTQARAAYDRAAGPDALSFDIPRSSPGLRPRGVASPPPPEGSGDRDAPTEAAGRPDELFDAAEAAWLAGKFGSALRACEAALAADPDWPEAHNLRGLVLEALGHPEDAAAAFLAAVRLDPSFTEARRNLTKAGDALEDDGDAPGEDASSLVVIRAFSFPSEAEIARGRLEAEDIPAVVMQGEITDMNWLFSNMVGGAKLCVREQDVQRALDVLDWNADAPHPDTRCPWCGSGQIHYQKYNLRWIYALILLFKLPLPIKKERWTCESCGASWKEPRA